MDLTLTGLFRELDIRNNPAIGPSLRNPGGGVARKAQQLQNAVPRLELVSDVSRLGEVSIIESLWFTGVQNLSEEVMWQRIEAYLESTSYKILWTSDLEFLRWMPSEREAIFDASDIVAGNSEYMVNLLRGYTDNVALLTDPFDISMVQASQVREPILYGCSQVILEKGIEMLVEVFERASAFQELERLFIGSPAVWGLQLGAETSHELDVALSRVCDRRIRSAAPAEVFSVAGKAWLMASFSRYESFGYSVVEALAGGCYVFTGDHLVYREKPVMWCRSVEEVFSRLQDFLVNNDRDGMNEGGRNFVEERYSPRVFREQLLAMVGRVFGA